MPAILSLGVKVGWATQQWCGCIALLGYAQRWLNRDSTWRRYMTDAVPSTLAAIDAATVSAAPRACVWQRDTIPCFFTVKMKRERAL